MGAEAARTRLDDHLADHPEWERLVPEDSPSIDAFVKRARLTEWLVSAHGAVVQARVREALRNTHLAEVAIEAAVAAQIMEERRHLPALCRTWARELLSRIPEGKEDELLGLLRERRALVGGFCHWLRPHDGLQIAANLLPITSNALHQWRLRYKRSRIGKLSPKLAAFLTPALLIGAPDVAQASVPTRRRVLYTISGACAIAGTIGLLAGADPDDLAEWLLHPTESSQLVPGNSKTAPRRADVTLLSIPSGPTESGHEKASVANTTSIPTSSTVGAPAIAPLDAALVTWFKWPGSAAASFYHAPSGSSSFHGGGSITVTAEGRLEMTLEATALGDSNWSCSGASEEEVVLFECSSEEGTVILLGWREVIEQRRILRGNSWNVTGADMEPLGAWVIREHRPGEPRAHGNPASWYVYADRSPVDEYRRVCRTRRLATYCSGWDTWSFPNRVSRAGENPQEKRSLHGRVVD